MGKLQITFCVDRTQLFDTLQALNGDTAPLGERLVATLLTGKADWRDEAGMAIYGVSVAPSPPTQEQEG